MKAAPWSLVVFSSIVLSGCAVLESPASWNAKPIVIDPQQVQFKAINSATSTINEMVSAGNEIRTKALELAESSRQNLDRASAGNYGFGILGAGVALSKLHPDALLGSAFLGGTHVALSQRLSPHEYLLQLQKTSVAFACLIDIAQDFDTVRSKAKTALTANSQIASAFSALGYSTDTEKEYTDGVRVIRQAFLRAIEVSQSKLDSKITLIDPLVINKNLITKVKEGAKESIRVETANGDPSFTKFLEKSVELDGKLDECITGL